jgi:GNAT superfamily N-acetyltransferase
MAVRETAQRSGVGRALVHGFTDMARLQGTHKLILHARRDNVGAHAFYTDLGWIRGGLEDDMDGRQWLPFSMDL